MNKPKEDHLALQKPGRSPAALKKAPSGSKPHPPHPDEKEGHPGQMMDEEDEEGAIHSPHSQSA
jgi:hypothetical protein